MPIRRPGRNPTREWDSSGRIDFEHRDRRRRPPHGDARSDLGSAFGDWRPSAGQVAALASAESGAPVGSPPRSPPRCGMQKPTPAGCSDDDHLALATADGDDPGGAGRPGRIRSAPTSSGQTSPTSSTGTSTSPISATSGCRFAPSRSAGRRRRLHPSPPRRSPIGLGGPRRRSHRGVYTGGIDPELPVTGYADLVRAVKARVPSMHACLQPDGDRQRRLARRRIGPRLARRVARSQAGHHPRYGGGDPTTRCAGVLTKGKLPTATWIDVVSTAHRVGLRSSSTMMYGHVDAPRHWVPTSTSCGPSRTTPAGSPSSCRCRSCTRVRRCTWPAPPSRADPPRQLGGARGWPA